MQCEESKVSEEINGDRRRFLATAAATVAAAQLGLARATAAAGNGGGELASLETATAWLNSAPLTAAGLRGKVVLVSFWTYSCSFWSRRGTRAWELSWCRSQAVDSRLPPRISPLMWYSHRSPG